MKKKLVGLFKSCLILTICLGVCLSSAIQASGEAVSGAPDPQAGAQHRAEPVPKPVRYIDPVFNKADVKKDITYGRVKNYKDQMTDLKLDVYQPSGDSVTSRPAIIFIHGGGMVGGSKADPYYFDGFLTEFAKRGYVVFSIDHRLRDDQSQYLEAMRDAAVDTATAVQWVIGDGAKYGVDTKHIILLGHSSGSDIISNLCYNDKMTGILPQDSVFAAVGISGGGVLTFIDGGGIKKEGPPCLLVKGTLDEYVAYEQCEELVGLLVKNGIKASLLKLENGTHLFKDDYYEVLDTSVQFLYNQLIGFNIRVSQQFAMEEINERRASGKTYKARQIALKVDGKLDEWDNSDILDFDQLELYTATYPSKAEFSGTAMLGWNEKDPARIYLAATITDDVITNYAPADGWWRWVDDTLELRIDLSEDAVLPNILLALGATGDLSEMATKENTEWAVVRKGNTSVYEFAFDLTKMVHKSPDMKGILENFKCTANKMIGIGAYYDDTEIYRSIGWVKGANDERRSYVNVVFDPAAAR